MADSFLNNAEYSAKAMLLMAKNRLVMGKLVDGQFKNEVTDQNGLSISVKRPPRFNRNDSSLQSAALATQDIVTGSINVKVDQYAKVHVSVPDFLWIQSYNDFMQSAVMKSAASTLAHQIDSFLAQKTLGFSPWIAGTAPGTRSANATDPTKMIATPSQASAAFTRLFDNGVPDDGSLSGVIGSDDAQSIAGSLTGQFLPGEINRPALERMRVPMVGNINFYSSQQLPSYTTGSRTQGDGASTGGQINLAGQNVNYRSVATTNTQTLNLKSLSANQTVKAGDVFTIQNVKMWDWRNNAILPDLMQFTVTADAQADGSGNVALTISPPIIVQGTNDGFSTDTNTAFGTVGTAPADSAYVQFAGAASTVLRVRSAFHKQAITMVSARLHTPSTGVSSFVSDPETGIGIRYWQGSDITSGVHVARWDCVFGATLTDPLMGTRVCGT